MKYRRLGGSGLWVSDVCLGLMSYGNKEWAQWVLEEEESAPFIKRALGMLPFWVHVTCCCLMINIHYFPSPHMIEGYFVHFVVSCNFFIPVKLSCFHLELPFLNWSFFELVKLATFGHL